MFRNTLLALFSIALTACGADSVVETNSEEKKDPVVEEVAIAFVKRVIIDEYSTDVRDVTLFNPGAELWLKQGSGVNASQTNITATAFGDGGDAYDVKHVSVSADATQLLFAMRAPDDPDLDEDEQAKWDIWRYDLNAKQLARVIPSNIVAQEGHDLFPQFLPDGRILFVSTRQNQNKAILLDEGKPQYQAMSDNLMHKAATLHVMDADGSNIKQISFSQGHDLYPQVLSTGKILFARFEHRGRNNGINLYQIDSDGKNLELLYGRHSHQGDELSLVSLTELPEQQVLAGYRTGQTNILSTDFKVLNLRDYMDVTRLKNGDETTTSAYSDAIFATSPMNGELSLQGKFHWLTPLKDGSERSLMVWSQCQLVENEQVVPCTEQKLAGANPVAAPDLFGIWLYNHQDNTQKPVVLAESGYVYEEVVVLDEFTPALQSETDGDAELLSKNLASLHIRSVYDFSGEDRANPSISALSNPQVVAERVSAVRFIKPVSMPDKDEYDYSNAAFGRSSGQLMRDVLGYAPVAPDGSVYVTLPANVPFAVELINANGERVGERHENWLQLVPGETRTCNGCHDSTNLQPHGGLNQQSSLNQGAIATTWQGSFGDIDAVAGETMAQSRARVMGLMGIQMEPTFANVWLQGVSAEADQSVSYNALTTPVPTTDACKTNWQAHCRVTIHFPEHIVPILTLPRVQLAEDGVTELANYQCNTCHSPQDSEGNLQIPAAQLDLSNTQSPENTRHSVAYRELLFNDSEQEVVDGVLLDKLVDVLDENGNPVYVLDENGEPVLDESGNPIVQQTTVTIRPPLSLSGAVRNQNFFSLFAQGQSHANYLTPAELRLFREWLDIGAQYLNSPFAEGAN